MLAKVEFLPRKNLHRGGDCLHLSLVGMRDCEGGGNDRRAPKYPANSEDSCNIFKITGRFRWTCVSQSSTPLGSMLVGTGFSTKVRPLWGPRSGQWLLNTIGKDLVHPIFDAFVEFQNGINENKLPNVYLKSTLSGSRTPEGSNLYRNVHTHNNLRPQRGRTNLQSLHSHLQEYMQSIIRSRRMHPS